MFGICYYVAALFFGYISLLIIAYFEAVDKLFAVILGGVIVAAIIFVLFTKEPIINSPHYFDDNYLQLSGGVDEIKDTNFKVDHTDELNEAAGLKSIGDIVSGDDQMEKIEDVKADTDEENKDEKEEPEKKEEEEPAKEEAKEEEKKDEKLD